MYEHKISHWQAIDQSILKAAEHISRGIVVYVTESRKIYEHHVGPKKYVNFREIRYKSNTTSSFSPFFVFFREVNRGKARFSNAYY